MYRYIIHHLRAVTRGQLLPPCIPSESLPVRPGLPSGVTNAVTPIQSTR
jgi:hypothetical protein